MLSPSSFFLLFKYRPVTKENTGCGSYKLKCYFVTGCARFTSICQNTMVYGPNATFPIISTSSCMTIINSIFVHK